MAGLSSRQEDASGPPRAAPPVRRGFASRRNPEPLARPRGRDEHQLDASAFGSAFESVDQAEPQAEACRQERPAEPPGERA
jgi:hypothetical protein